MIGNLGIAGLLLASALAAQEAPPHPQPSPSPSPSPAELPVAEPQPAQRPGRFRVGPFFLTPTFRVGSIGLDTNVFYTPTERQTDVSANGGPGLDIALPFGGSGVQLYTGGAVDYTYFVRTESQRRFGGNVRGGLALKGNRLEARVEEGFSRSFQRPNFEVDRRLLLDQWSTRGTLALRTVGRLFIRAEAGRQSLSVASDEAYFGTDLRRTLTRDLDRGVLGLEYRLSIKTSFLVAADYERDRFPQDASRDADSNRIYAGFDIESDTRLAGRAVGGVRLFRPLIGGAAARRDGPYASVDLSYRFGPGTLLKGLYAQDLQYSAFDVAGTSPTLTVESYGGRLEKVLVGHLELFLSGTLWRFRTSGAITVVSATGRTTAVRSDHVRQGGADLGYRFRSRLRIGVAAVYTERRSTIADFGIQGLLVGGTVTYTPGAGARERNPLDDPAWESRTGWRP